MFENNFIFRVRFLVNSDVVKSVVVFEIKNVVGVRMMILETSSRLMRFASDLTSITDFPFFTSSKIWWNHAIKE